MRPLRFLLPIPHSGVDAPVLRTATCEAADVGLLCNLRRRRDHLAVPHRHRNGLVALVFLTQSVHEHLLNTATRLRRDRITGSSDLRVDRLRHAVYIDDLILVGLDRVEMAAAQAEYVGVANSRHLPVKPSKVVAPSIDGVDCLGMEINGTEHTVGLRPDKLDALCHDTRDIIDRGQATGRQLAEIVGRWTWAMLVARPALSVFNAVYRYINTAGRRLFTLWPSVVMELWTAAPRPSALRHPHLGLVRPRARLRRSLDGQGVCAARCSARRRRRRLALGRPAQRRPGGRSRPQSPLLAAPWTTIVSSPWREQEHINKLELRSASTALRWALSSPLSIRRRLLLLSDSQVAVGALSKGRSSSHPILCRLRPINALLLASGIQLYTRWIASADNPADAPSRAFSPA